MLYARCAFCGAIVPLWCSGRFMPHVPTPVNATQMGATCGYCGVLPPVFTCGFCWGQQLLVLPGMQPPAAMPGAQQTYAPVVHAQQGASEGSLKKMFGALGEGFMNQAGKNMANAMFGQQQFG
jgi:hypothetical protein